MDRLRLAPLAGSTARLRCCRCDVGDHNWDQIGGQAYCANCQEELAQGVGDALVVRTEASRCVVCARRGTVRYCTVPLHAPSAVEMDMCGEHLRALIGRSLGPYAYHQLRRQLRTLNVGTEDVFLLHSEFYDLQGKALRPVVVE